MSSPPNFPQQELSRLVESAPQQNQAAYLITQGLALHQQGKFKEAQSIYEQILVIQANHFDALQLLGALFAQTKQFTKAIDFFSKALLVNPNHAACYSNRGNALRELGLLDEALESYDQAINIEADYAEAYFNYGNALTGLGRLDEALESYDQAISIKADYSSAHWNLALCHLLSGNFKDGWQGYEWRWKLSGVRNFSQPLWLGAESLIDKTILLYAEQGFGDTIQFCRYAKLVAELGAKVILEVQHPLVNLLKDLDGVSQIIAMGDPLPAFDYQCPLMSLPLAFNTLTENIPTKIPYIKAISVKEEYWKIKLKTTQKLKVGLVWNGGFGPNLLELWGVNERRNIPLALIAKVNISSVDFYSLQKGEPSESELAQSGDQYWQSYNFHNYVSKLEDFSDTAALIANLDLIISVDTSTAHLAAAMGKPVWLLNRFDTCWRWMLDKDDSPWYPTVKLYRQEKMNDWNSVIEKIKSDLERLVNIEQF